MGNTESRNTLGVTANAFVNQLNETVQNVDASALNSIAFNISNVDGDVNYQGNTIKQEAKVSVRALQNSIMCNSAVQGLSQKLMQAAESLTSGLPLGSSTEASNSISASVNMAMNLRNHVGQTCVARATNEFVFNADKVRGNVNITGNTFDQQVSAIAECAQTTLASNSSMQTSSQDASQSASAVTKGLDPADIMRSLALLIGVGALAFVLVGLTSMKAMGRAMKNLLKLVFVLILCLIFIALLIGGLVLIIKSTGFPEVFTYSNVDFEQLSGGAAPKDMKSDETLFRCGEMCKNDKEYTAFLWEPNASVPEEGTQAKTPSLSSIKGTCRLFTIKVPEEEEKINKVRLEIRPACPNPPPVLPSAAPTLESMIDTKVEISRAMGGGARGDDDDDTYNKDRAGVRFGVRPRDVAWHTGWNTDEGDIVFSTADVPEAEPAKGGGDDKSSGPPCNGAKDGEGPMSINEDTLPPEETEAAAGETSKASSSLFDSELSQAEDKDGPVRCGRITTGWKEYKECYSKIDKKLKEEERKTKECACLETLVTSTRTEGESSTCSFDARKVYYSGNAALGTVCPTSNVFDPKGAPCGMPGQKIVDLSIAKNWMGAKDAGILRFAGLNMKYSIASYILFALALVFLLIIIVASRALRDKTTTPTKQRMDVEMVSTAPSTPPAQ